MLGNFVQHAACQRGHVAFAEHLRHGAHGEGVAAEAGKIKPVFAQGVAIIGQCGGFFVAGGKGDGYQQLLAGDLAVFLALGFHFFVIHALGGGVHVD